MIKNCNFNHSTAGDTILTFSSILSIVYLHDQIYGQSIIRITKDMLQTITNCQLDIMLKLYQILRNRHKAYGACTVDESLLGWRASKGSNGIAFTRWSRHCTAVTPAPVRPYKAPEVDQLIVHPPYNTPAL